MDKKTGTPYLRNVTSELNLAIPTDTTNDISFGRSLCTKQTFTFNIHSTSYTYDVLDSTRYYNSNAQ